MKSSEDLRDILRRIDRRSYPAYKDTRGVYHFSSYILRIEHVQGDPFAAPSSLSITVPGRLAAFPAAAASTPWRRTALEDLLLRRFARAAAAASKRVGGSGKSGLISCARPGQEILRRSDCEIDPETLDVTVRFHVGFPAHGRTIDSRALEEILYEYLPEAAEKSLYYDAVGAAAVSAVSDLADDQQAVREALAPKGLVAFIADGSVLPRESGVSERPLAGAVPFQSPEGLRVTMPVPHRGSLTGMGIRRGVTLIVGGGYHGKSTLLKALERGVYSHIAGDGREFVLTDPAAVKIRAEDGRSIASDDISLFIHDLPNGKDTVSFSTEDASGSTSQAANTVEAIEAGASCLLIDEDTSATNFMVRDEIMQRVISPDQEPITPFIERIRQLYDSFGISTVLVAGSSGAFFSCSDDIIQMDRYTPILINDRAKAAAASAPAVRLRTDRLGEPAFARVFPPDRGLRDRGRVKIRVNGTDGFDLNHETVDLRCVEQLADSAQLTFLAHCLVRILERDLDGHKNLREAVSDLEADFEKEGFAALFPEGRVPAGLAEARPQEIFAALDRWRGFTANDGRRNPGRPDAGCREQGAREGFSGRGYRGSRSDRDRRGSRNERGDRGSRNERGDRGYRNERGDRGYRGRRGGRG